MKLKKYEAKTEQDAMEKVKQELGPDALVLSIKKTQPRGLFAFLRKPTVEVTAAYEEKDKKTDDFSDTGGNSIAAATPENYFEQRIAASEAKHEPSEEDPNFLKLSVLNLQDEKIRDLEQKLNSTGDMLHKALDQLTVAKRIQADGARRYDNNMLQVFYEALTAQGVLPQIAEKVLEELSLVEDELDLTTIVKIVYNKLILMLGKPHEIRAGKAKKSQARVFCFLGPTGVGKTTTLAKLTSRFTLTDGLKVCFITADTYRIAAVAQLKTYGEILGIDTEVVYNNDDLAASLRKNRVLNDVIMIDTAGRSHANEQNMKELETLLKAIPKAESFLVLSTTTKFEDLMAIIETYSQFAEFSLIFTKLDETNCMGSILNTCYLTGKKVAFVTNGQNVPDDIEKMRPDKIARALMGLGGGCN